MKRFAIILAALLLAACNATMPIKPESPAQIAAQVCPPLKTTLDSLSLLVLDPKVTADLMAASVAVNLVCNAGAAVTVVNLADMRAKALPLIIGAIKAGPLTDAQKNTLILDVTIAQVVLQGLEQAAANVGAAP